MNITITLLFQVIAFLILIWLVKRYMWVPLSDTLNERQKKIEEGLEAAEKGKADFQLAEQRANDVIADAKKEAQEILAQANKRSREIEEEAIAHSKEVGQKQIDAAKSEIEQEVNNVRNELRKEIGGMVISGVRQVIDKEVDAKAHAKLIDNITKQI